MDQVLKANQLYRKIGGTTRDDAVAMQYIVPGWAYDPKKPSLNGRPVPTPAAQYDRAEEPAEPEGALPAR
jgi:hypothetical protein